MSKPVLWRCGRCHAASCLPSRRDRRGEPSAWCQSHAPRRPELLSSRSCALLVESSLNLPHRPPLASSRQLLYCTSTLEREPPPCFTASIPAVPFHSMYRSRSAYGWQSPPVRWAALRRCHPSVNSLLSCALTRRP